MASMSQIYSKLQLIRNHSIRNREHDKIAILVSLSTDRQVDRQIKVTFTLVTLTKYFNEWGMFFFSGLTDNNLVGSLPPTIGLLEDIIWLDVGVNRINGTLPVSNNVNIGVGLDNLTKARHLYVIKCNAQTCYKNAI